MVLNDNLEEDWQTTGVFFRAWPHAFHTKNNKGKESKLVSDHVCLLKCVVIPPVLRVFLIFIIIKSKTTTRQT